MNMTHLDEALQKSPFLMLTFVEKPLFERTKGSTPSVKVIASNGLTSLQLKQAVFLSKGLTSSGAKPGALYLMLFREGRPQLVKLEADAQVLKKDLNSKTAGTKIKVPCSKANT